MLLNVFVLLPSLLDLAAGGFTTKVPKTRLGQKLPRVTPSQNVRDRRMTHWESQTHSNFDDGDRIPSNGDSGQITYPSVPEEPSLLRSPLNFNAFGKSTSPNFGKTGAILSDENSGSDYCLDDVVPPGSMYSWLLSASRKNLEIARGLRSGSGKFMVPRCRRTIEGWTIQRPIYAEEPRWILIELNRENSGGSSLHHQEDPFYVARGKKMSAESSGTKMADGESGISEKVGSLSAVVPPENSRSRKFPITTRMKRDALGDDLRKYLLEGGVSSVLSSKLTERIRENGYVNPRNKHSDILDILKEPFFISRGKKNSVGIQRSESNDGYSAALVNFEERKEVLDSWQRKGAKRICDSNSSKCSNLGMRTDENGSEPFRDRRGVMEELLKEADPFYLARGKRSSDTIQEFDETSELLESAEIVNGISVQH